MHDKIDEFLEYILEDCLWSADTPDMYEIYLTGKGNFRDEWAVTAPYKGNRDGPKPLLLPDAREYMVDAWGAVVVDGMEADDKIAIRATELGYDCIIASIDKDFLQIPCRHYNTRKGEFTEVDPLEGMRFFYSQILTGDRQDNVIGLYGIGPVKAKKLLKDCQTDRDMYEVCLEAYGGDLERVLENGRLLWLIREEGELWLPPK